MPTGVCVWEQKEFKGKAGSSVKVRLGGSSPAKTVLLVGLGKSSALKPASFSGVSRPLSQHPPPPAALCHPSHQPSCLSLPLPLPSCLLGVQLGSAVASEVKAEKPKTVGIILPSQAGTSPLPCARTACHAANRSVV